RLPCGDQHMNLPAHRVGEVASMLALSTRQTLFAILFPSRWKWRISAAQALRDAPEQGRLSESPDQPSRRNQ
ncbi:hypothetical protein, partial [uncultured Sphingomonas sp.]